MYCKNCGAQIADQAIICVKCGVPTDSAETCDNNNEWLTALLLCLFLGWTGAHRFYTNNTDTAIVQLVLGILSCGTISAIWSFIDFILILSGNFTKGDGQLLTHH